MTSPGDETFRTHPADAVVSVHGWCRLPSGLEVTREPLVDATSGTTGLYARLSQPDAGDACKAVGGRLPTREEVIQVLGSAHLLPPYLMAYDNLMASRARCEEHDSAVRMMLGEGVYGRLDWPDTPPWDGVKPVGNIGKHRIHVAGMNPRVDEAICGWRKRDGTLWQKGTGAIPSHHGPGAAVRTDYGTTTIAVRDPGISKPPADARPPGAPMRPTIRIGSTGAHVGVWQRIVGATVDERFGPGTEAKTRVWQATAGLHADGIVGPQSWRAAGETPAVAPAGGASPACRAALRDADAAWPNRRRASDGIMGDASHQARPSDHNLGNAVDITHDPTNGCDGDEVARLALTDPRVTHVIWNRRIANRSIESGDWRPYNGSNPHKHHCHISIHAAARNDASPWPWATH